MNSPLKTTALVLAVTASWLISSGGSANAAPSGLPLTVSLPTANLDISVGTAVLQPVRTTNIDSTLNYIAFQGDFTYDQTVINFVPPIAQAAGLTAINWTVSGTLLPGPGPIRTLRVSAFVNDGVTPLHGSGTLYNLRMVSVSNTPGASTTLTWSPAPDNFIFIDTDLNFAAPAQTNGSVTITGPTPFPTCVPVNAGFDDITTLAGTGWAQINNSQPGPGVTNWFQGVTAAFPAQSGAPNSYVAANYDNGTGLSTLSNWVLTPPMVLDNAGQLTFWTRTVDTPVNPDRLQVRVSINGASQNVGSTATSVGDFTALLLDINPTYTLSDYPVTWTQFTVTISGLGGPTTGRLAFRYFVENAGPLGTNADYIGLDTVHYTCPVPTPTPTATPSPTTTPSPTPTSTPTPSPTPTPTPTLTPTPTPTPINISGAISYCPNPVPGPVPNVTLTLTGSGSGTVLSDGSSNYQFSLRPDGTYTVTPTKTALLPGSAGINTTDVITTQKQFTSGSFIPPGCRLMAADVTGDALVTTTDVIAIQRFFLGFTSSTANVGKYKFTPSSRTYPGVNSNQTVQNYDTLIFGDVASHFAE